jgi:2,3-dihydroxybenzoate-AMP ligase
LLVRGPYTLRGYFNADEHNRRAFTEDGFYRSGDLARITPAGQIVVEGRVKDIVIRGGNKIASGEVEGHLVAHPNVAAAAVVPVPDEYLGERICAFIVGTGEPPTLRQLKQVLLERGLAEFKLPDRVEVVGSFPLTPLGKVDKKALAALASTPARKG